MKIDDKIANIECLLQLFKNIHPNLISIFGIICNFYIIKFLHVKNKYAANIFLVARYFADIMDGAVARRFNKTSKIGGYLDTFDDILLMSFYSGYIIWYLTKNINKAILICLLSISIGIYYLKTRNSLFDHSNLKKGAENILDKIVEFFVNNSIFTFLGLFFINVYLL